MNPREKDIGAKKEGNNPNFNKFIPKITPPVPSSSRSSSSQWSNHKNPRIVRVSRVLGGKDRHSKVCTVRGLRDRRIRLSVPTAIQLYDLQERLGLSQPSKVVDWLLDATKDDIDKLPPLPMLPQNKITQLFHQPTLANYSYQIEPNGDVPQTSLSHSLMTSSSNHSYAKDVGINNPTIKEGIKMVEQENNQVGFGGFVAQNLFPNMPYNNHYFHFDPPSLSLSQFGGGFPFSNQTHEDHHYSQNNISTVTFPSTLVPTFPASYITQAAPIMDQNEWRSQTNLFQQNPLLPTTTLQLISSPMKSFALNVTSRTVHDTETTDKDDTNSSRQ